MKVWKVSSLLFHFCRIGIKLKKGHAISRRSIVGNDI